MEKSYEESPYDNNVYKVFLDNLFNEQKKAYNLLRKDFESNGLSVDYSDQNVVNVSQHQSTSISPSSNFDVSDNFHFKMKTNEAVDKMFDSTELYWETTNIVLQEMLKKLTEASKSAIYAKCAEIAALEHHRYVKSQLFIAQKLIENLHSLHSTIEDNPIKKEFNKHIQFLAFIISKTETSILCSNVGVTVAKRTELFTNEILRKAQATIAVSWYTQNFEKLNKINNIPQSDGMFSSMAYPFTPPPAMNYATSTMNYSTSINYSNSNINYPISNINYPSFNTNYPASAMNYSTSSRMYPTSQLMGYNEMTPPTVGAVNTYSTSSMIYTSAMTFPTRTTAYQAPPGYASSRMNYWMTPTSTLGSITNASVPTTKALVPTIKALIPVTNALVPVTNALMPVTSDTTASSEDLEDNLDTPWFRHPKHDIFCSFCKSNGERNIVYKSHILKNKFGTVVCPILRRYICPICGVSGSDAHTVKYCPKREYNY